MGNPSLWRAADWMQTNKMVSQIISMISEDRDVKAILDELLGPDGVSLNMVPSRAYILAGDSAPFSALATRVLLKGGVLCGYQLANKIKREGYDTVINPRDKTTPQTWDGYLMIVLKGRTLYKKPPPDEKLNFVDHSPTEPITKQWVKEEFASLMHLVEEQELQIDELMGNMAATTACSPPLAALLRVATEGMPLNEPTAAQLAEWRDEGIITTEEYNTTIRRFARLPPLVIPTAAVTTQ